MVGVVPAKRPGAVATDGSGIVRSAKDFIESDDVEGFPGSWGADLSSKRPVAEPAIGQYDWDDSGECEKRDHLGRMFGRCVTGVQDAGMASGQTLAPSPPSEARNSKTKKRRPIVLP
jgi:hypothetical protein